jgi:hypothetical protein
LRRVHGRPLEDGNIFGVGPDRNDDRPSVPVGDIGHVDRLDRVPLAPEEGREEGIDPSAQDFREHVHGVLVGVVVVRGDEAEVEVAVFDVALEPLDGAFLEGGGHG